MDLVRVATIVPQNAGDFTKIFVESDGVRFSVVPGLDGCESLGVGLNERRKLEQEVAPGGSREVTPGRRFKGRSGGCDGDVDVFGCSGVDRGDFGLVTLGRVLAWMWRRGVGLRVVRGVYSGYFLALFRLDPFVVYEETDRLGVFTAIGGCELN